MKILIISEFFPPTDFGGAEWSSYYLANDLSKMGHKVYVLTPKWRANQEDKNKNFTLIQFPFYRRDKLPSTLNLVNPFWLLYVSWQIIKTCKKNNIEVIHINGKYSIPPARIANLFLGKKLLATIRDYQVICTYGFCIYEKNKSCNLFEYFRQDFAIYWKTYVKNKNLLSLLINIFFAIFGRITRNYLMFFSKGLPLVVLSRKQKDIFLANGFEVKGIIGNSIDFLEKFPKKISKNQIIYAGRLTPGKGVNLLINIMPVFFKKYPNYKFIFAGQGLFEEKLKKLSKKYKNLNFKGKIDHEKVLDLFKASKLCVVPSVWPEPFGRVALESLSVGTPVVATKKGGLEDIVKDGLYGYLARASSDDILLKIEEGIENNISLRNKIKDDYSKLAKIYSKNIAESYIKIYKTL